MIKRCVTRWTPARHPGTAARAAAARRARAPPRTAPRRRPPTRRTTRRRPPTTSRCPSVRPYIRPVQTIVKDKSIEMILIFVFPNRQQRKFHGHERSIEERTFVSRQLPEWTQHDGKTHFPLTPLFSAEIKHNSILKPC